MEKEYLETFLEPIRKCIEYCPKFGQSSKKGFSLTDFKSLYSADPFYSWIGLDNDLMYAAHRAAGGMTSIYRQIGIGCERLFRKIITDCAAYTDPSFATWSYTTKTQSGKIKTLSLDARLDLSEIRNKQMLTSLKKWIKCYCEDLGNTKTPSKGVIFEIRQGYKSKDSKRQNADIDNATVAWANDFLPVFAIFSSQIDSDIILRYRNNRCGVLIGTTERNSQVSLYAFCREIMGYDLANFFKNQSDTIKEEIHNVLEALLSAE